MNTNFKSIKVEDILFFDMECVRRNKELDVNSKEFELYQYKLRNRETDELPSVEVTVEDYNRRGALKMGFNKIVTIGAGYVRNSKLYIKHIQGTEEEVLNEFFKITQNFKYICGYNIIQFDLPMCVYNASKYFDITSILNPAFNVSQKKIWDMKNVIDLMDVIRGTHFSNVSLDEALYHYNIPSSKDDISGAQVSEVYYTEGPDRIYEYVKKDVLATVNLFLKLQYNPTFDSFIDRSGNKDKEMELPLLGKLYLQNYLSEEIKEELEKILSKKKITKKDKENIQIILEGVYIRDEFMASDDKETIERKKMEVSEFLKNNIK